MRARDIMTREVVTVRPDTPVLEVIQVLLDNRISGVPVVEGERLVGIVSEADLILRERALRPRTKMAYIAQQLFENHDKLAEEFRKAHGLLASQVMSRELHTCRPGTPVEEIANIMAEWHVKRVPVVDRDRLVGLVSRADVLRAAARRLVELKARQADDRVDDHQIRATLLAALEREPWAEVDRLQVDVRDGEVRLTGLAESPIEREAIETAARAIVGVRAVHNQLEIQANVDLERPAGQ